MDAPVSGGTSAAKGRKCAPGRLLARICTLIRQARQPSEAHDEKSVGAEFAASGVRPPPFVDEKAAMRNANALLAPQQDNGSGGCVARLPRLLRLHEERARRLGARFGVEIPPGYWPTTPSTTGGIGGDPDDAIRRLHKPIRVRMRRTCHECQTVFGPGVRECAACHHIRCHACGRQTPRHGDPEKQKLAAARDNRDRQAAAAAVALLLRNGDLGEVGGSRTSSSAHSSGSRSSTAPLVADPVLTDMRITTPLRPPPYMMTVPARTGGADLVYRKPRQRVRRTCCQCSKVFPTGKRACAGEGCVHLRCPDCPREPPSRLNFEDGVAEDNEGADGADKDAPAPAPAPFQHRCHLCRTKYPLSAPEGTVCVACAHARCGTCPRINTPLRRSAPAYVPAFMPPAAAAPTGPLPATPTPAAQPAPVATIASVAPSASATPEVPAVDAQLTGQTLNG